MSKREFGFILLDLIWPTLNIAKDRKKPPLPAWTATRRSTEDVLDAAYATLKDALSEQDDRLKIVDSKLQSVSSIAPIIITLLLAIITFLTSGKLTTFTTASVLIVEIGGCYVALQFLRALLAAIGGLSVRSFSSVFFEQAPARLNETKPDYVFRICKALSSAVYQNREVINEKVSQLKLSHVAVRNAVWGLVIITLTLLSITIIETKTYWVGIIILSILLTLVLALTALRLSSR